MTVSEALLSIVDLTKKNLDLLEMINNSFYTKSSHLSTTVDGVGYVIPSYIALENKVNHLQDGFNNLVKAAQSGTAWINFDGNSKVINLQGFQQAPSPIDLSEIREFDFEKTTIFKDMLNPKPFVRFGLGSLADNITQVNVKKVVLYKTELINDFKGRAEGMAKGDKASGKLSWADCVGLKETYIPGVDYDEYDSLYTLPIRHNTKAGTYVVEEIISDVINEDLDNIVTVKIHEGTPLKVIDFDGAYKEDLTAVGDNGLGVVLTTYDGSAKLKVIDINPSKYQLTLKVLSGEYVNLQPAGKENLKGQDLINNVSDYSILRFYEDVDDQRELHVALEEDRYVFITIAPVNSTIGIQTAWGDGLFIDTYMLREEGGQTFNQYYTENVTNIGDALAELANTMYPNITKYTEGYGDAIFGKPTLLSDTVNVVQINKHINEADSVKTIRSLYSQKKQYQLSLSEVQNKITSLTEELSQISFDDLSGVRSAYEAQLTDLRAQQNELNASISSICDNIARAANDSVIPLEGGKFRIRGYVDVERFIEDNFSLQENSGLTKNDILNLMVGTQVMYRYKNPDIPQANVSVVKDFLFTEWNVYEAPKRPRSMSYKNGKYIINYQDTTVDESTGEIVLKQSDNRPKFNQIDIPINQGEIVEMQVRIIWGFGYPYATVATQWSEPIEVTFPEELVKDVQVTTIIEENNSDIESLRFDNILANKGVTEHVDSSIQDQDIKYYHKSDDIASGFFTQERRVIPLRDKLTEMNNTIQTLMSMVQGTTSDAINVSVNINGISTTIQPDVVNTLYLPAWNTLDNGYSGNVITKNSNLAEMFVSINIANAVDTPLRLFPIFPGPRDRSIDELIGSTNPEIFNPLGLKIKDQGFIGQISDDSGNDNWDVVWLATDSTNDNVWKNAPESGEIGRVYNPDDYSEIKTRYQSPNQFIYFRNRSPFTGGELQGADCGGLHIWPYIQDQYDLCVDGDSVDGVSLLNKGKVKSVILKIDWNNPGKNGLVKTIGFNLRYSLYKDPVYYEIKFVAKVDQNDNDLLASAQTKTADLVKYNTTVN